MSSIQTKKRTVSAIEHDGDGSPEMFKKGEIKATRSAIDAYVKANGMSLARRRRKK